MSSSGKRDMQSEHETNFLDVLNEEQLTRIESIHRGFLYQHLYAVGCLLSAQSAGVKTVIVERDEDIELVTENGRIYIQVKTRSKPIIPSDVNGALDHFKLIRNEHAKECRSGTASFVIAVNQPPSPALQQAIRELPADTIVLSPGSDRQFALPPTWTTLEEAVSWCVAQAEKLNFSLLSPASLVWKLAGLVQLAATGSALNSQHSFSTEGLPALFEQLVVQLQDFPAIPPVYRPQGQEPSFGSGNRVRIVCGLSGAGKTTWASHASLHCALRCAYYDVGDLPGTALATTLVRELAAKFATADRYGLRKVILPGASGYDALRTFDAYLEEKGESLLVVLDNAHRIPVENLRDTLNATARIRFILLCQPHPCIRELEAITGLERESLIGWDLDTVAAAVDEEGGFGTANGFEQLRIYTGGLPLYVQSAAKIAVAEYGGDIDALNSDLQTNENIVETAQEVILTRVFGAFEGRLQDALALLSVADVGLSREEVTAILVKSLNVTPSGVASMLRKLRASGVLEVFGNQTLKIHDAVRTIGRQHLEQMSPPVINDSLLALKEQLIRSLQKNRDTSRFALLTQIFIKLNDVMTLIALSGEEMFYEMGITVDILETLENASSSEDLDPIHKFWALDGLAFADIREGNLEKLPQRFEAMESLLVAHKFGFREEVAYAMKQILYFGLKGDRLAVQRHVEQATPKLPDAEQERIFDYNHAIALWKLKRHRDAEALCKKVVDGYYELLGIRPNDVIGKNSDVLWKVIKRPANVQEHLKHLADALELYALTREAQGESTPFLRIHAMKFYNMAGAPESMVRVGQDLADEFVAMKQYVGAKEVMEQHVLPVVSVAGLVNRLIQVRSQYAVILALCGQHKAAVMEMQRLEPYIEGLEYKQRLEIENQSRQIAGLALRALIPRAQQTYAAVGRNEQCPCGSGVKFKKCHGAV